MVSLTGRQSALPWTILVIGLAARSCTASMAAWFTTIGPQIIRQNMTTGAIMYSSCNSMNTPVFPNDPPNLLSLSFEPRNGTALTGQGWWDQKKTAASIFYHTKDGDIVNTYHECNPKTGKFNKINDRIISEGAPPVHNTTGLASVLISDKDGYRIYYHDTNKTIQSIGYDPTNNNFYYAGVVSRDRPTGFALGAQFNSGRNISVVYPRDGSNIGVSRLNNDGRFWLSTTPRPLAGNVTSNTNTTNATDIKLDMQATTNFTLAGWTGAPKALGISIDGASTRNIFWVGADRALHQIANINSVWRPLNTNQSAQFWPLADNADAEFALASDSQLSVVRIYYDVNKTLTEIKLDTDGLWKPAAALPLVNLTAPDPPAPSSPNSGPSQSAMPDQSNGGSGQLSIGAKAGIGVGVAVGVVAVMGAVLAVCLMRRKQRALAAAEAEAEAQAMEEKRRQAAFAAQQQQQQQNQQYYYGGSPPQPETPFSDRSGAVAYGWDKKSMGSPPPPPQELHTVDPAVELAGQHYAHELPEQRPMLEMDAGAAESTRLMHEGHQQDQHQQPQARYQHQQQQHPR